MERHEAPRQPDAVLLPFLQERDEMTSQRLLEQLVWERAEPIIKGILRRKAHGFFNSQDAEDLRGEAIAQLLVRLRNSKANPDGQVISNFQGYVAVTTFRVCDTHLRRNYPQRWNLKDRLRYLLRHQAGFALWENTDGDWLCGFAAWRDEGKTAARNARFQQLRDNPQAFAKAALPGENVQRMNLPHLMAAIFDYMGSPIELDDLVNAVAELQDIKDLRPQSPAEDDDNGKGLSLEDLPSADPTPFDEVEWAQNLEWLWQQMLKLPLDQRRAFVLNAEFIHELPPTGVASIRDIAAALEVPHEKLYAVWGDIPLDDNAIAQHFSMTRASIPVWRMRARERLGRSLAEREH
jgi:hypothetical protein